MTIYGNYDTESETLDSKVDVLGYKYNINYHPINTMGGFDSSEFKKEIGKIDYKKKNSKRDWLSFVKDNSSYFDVEEESEEFVILTTRENGNVGDEEYGIEDIEEAKSIVKKIKEKYPKTKVSIYTVDEFVYLELENTNEREKEYAGGGKTNTIEEDELMKKNGIVLLQGSPTISGQILARKNALKEIEKSEKAGESDVYPSMLERWKKNHKETIKKLEELKKSYAGGGNVSKIYVVEYEVNGNKKTSEYLLYENDKVEKMLPSNAKIISIKEKMMAGGSTTKRGGAMVLAKQIRKDGESWQSALKRANQQLKK